jgi:PEP-CTERM motif
MSNLTRFLSLLACMAAMPIALHADTYSFTISTAPANNDPALTFIATGTLTGAVDPFNSGALDINAITGSANGYNFLGVVDPNMTDSQHPATSNTFTFDNVLYINGPHTDSLGFLLNLSSPAGTSLAHVFYTGITSANPQGYEVDVIDPNDPAALTPFSIDTFTIEPTVAPVPEPSTFVLFGTGLLGMGGIACFRMRRENLTGSRTRPNSIRSI